MAVELVRHLADHGRVHPDELAIAFAQAFVSDPYRGYGASVHRLLVEISAGRPWRQAAGEPFGGTGSMGNGSAMRAPPLGAWFADAFDVPAIILVEADQSAAVTHPHPEGIAGAQAVALAAALAARTAPNEFSEAMWSNILGVLPDSLVRRGIEAAASIPGDAPLSGVAAELGNGSQILCIDTVPVCLWLAAHNGGNFELAMRRTAAISGDIDTNCAIVGGIIGLLEGMELPEEWRRRRMPVPLLED
jgi:ADP-ribosylglycohydrolase